MAKLEEKTQMEIDTLSEKSNETYDNGDFRETINLLKLMWEKLPDSKFIYDESYHIASDIALISIELEDFKQARQWAYITKKCDPERQDIGEKEFLIGQVAYESGDMVEAKKFIEIANEKSEGRCFRGQDKKYKKLLK